MRGWTGFVRAFEIEPFAYAGVAALACLPALGLGLGLGLGVYDGWTSAVREAGVDAAPGDAAALAKLLGVVALRPVLR